MECVDNVCSAPEDRVSADGTREGVRPWRKVVVVEVEEVRGSCPTGVAVLEADSQAG